MLCINLKWVSVADPGFDLGGVGGGGAGLSPRMHQTLRVTPFACGLEAPKWHGLILASVIINNKDLLKTQLIFKFYAQIS